MRILFEMYCEMPCIAPRPKSEASCAPASVDMLMLLPSELPMFAPISFAASISIEPGMKMPACPSLSYTSSSTGMMFPPCSSEVMPMPSLSPCNRAAPTRSVFRGMTRPDTRTATETRIDEHEERYSLTRLLREHDYAAGLIAGPHLEAKLRQCHNPGIVSMITRSPNWEWLRALWSRAWMTDPKRAMAIVSRDISPKDEHGNRQDPAAVMDILRQGSGVAKEAAAQTLDKVKHAMQIDYFA